MMNEKIDQIRELLLQLERDSICSEADSFEHNFDALELPALVAQVVDYLQPKLYPYEAAIYWHMFRHSIVADGTQRVRVSVRGLCSGVVTSSSGQGEKLSYGAVQEALRGLEEKRAIRKDGDTNREGTPYLVFLPEEIPWCLDLIKQRQSEQASSRPVDTVREVDYYNIADNRSKIFERDGFKCTYCRKQLTRFSATIDHIQPVSKGGTNAMDNLVTACLHCNSSRGNRPVMEALKAKEAEPAVGADR
jgi:5-methylcytosine-specific restriction endonuclease McrA